VQSGTSNTVVEDGEKRDDRELAALLGPAATTLLKQRQSISQAYTREKEDMGPAAAPPLSPTFSHTLPAQFPFLPAPMSLSRSNRHLLLCFRQTCPSLSKASKTAQGAALPDSETLWTPKCLKQTLYAGT
jgi:hypothetical protein